ncbi:PRC-barrel domain-containing protein [Bacillus salitolerans]|uniref:PRC-barrel domain-containing protein n=1 Tax=Bacillus salitolerans TaxID=1437434 RepID=A0ABW4LQD3_9BACI
MRTFSLIKGLPVFHNKTGKYMGTIRDLLLSNKGDIQSIVVDGKGLFHPDHLIDFNHIISFGQDGVMIHEHLEQLKRKKAESYYLSHHHGLLGRDLYSTEGERLGIIDDVYFDEKLGTILGYEVSEGFFADIAEGKKVIPTKNPLQFGEDIIQIEIDT